MRNIVVLLVFPFLVLIPSFSSSQEPGKDQKISFNGYIQVRWMYDSRPAKVPRTSFFVQTAALELKADIGKRMRADIKITGKADMIFIEDAFLRWKPNKDVDIRFGRLKMPFSREELKPPTELVTIGKSQINDIMEGIALLGRDTGINMEISRRVMGLDLIAAGGIFNGVGLESYKDIDNPKQFVGRATLSSQKGLFEVGLNGVWRKEGDGAAWGFGADFFIAPFNALRLEGEVIRGKGMGLEAFGGYLVGSYRLGDFEPYARMELIEKNMGRRGIACVGLSRYLSKDLRAQIQLEGIFKKGESYFNVLFQGQGKY